MSESHQFPRSPFCGPRHVFARGADLPSPETVTGNQGRALGLYDYFRVGDHPFPIVWQPVIGLETAGGALLRHAGKESPMAGPVAGVFPQRCLWGVFPPRSPGACGNVVTTFLAKGNVGLLQALGFPYWGRAVTK